MGRHFLSHKLYVQVGVGGKVQSAAVIVVKGKEYCGENAWTKVKKNVWDQRLSWSNVPVISVVSIYLPFLVNNI